MLTQELMFVHKICNFTMCCGFLLHFGQAVIQYQRENNAIREAVMYQYHISSTLIPLSEKPDPDMCVLTLLTSEELDQRPQLPGLEQLLCHTPTARDARVCKAETHRNYLCGTITTPRHTKEQAPITFGYLLTPNEVILCDDTGAARTMVQRVSRENPQMEKGVGSFFYAFLELLIAKDMHHLQELEEKLDQLEDQVLAGQMEDFNPRMTAVRKEIAGWIRYYTQLDDMVCEFQENENEYFSENELRLFHMVEKRIERLKDEAQMLREYGLQVRELFQAEIDIRQNRIMKILTIVTTIFLPLSLVAGWYGMNFVNMPELTWKYGYPAVIGASVLVVLVCLWIMKKKKFW